MEDVLPILVGILVFFALVSAKTRRPSRRERRGGAGAEPAPPVPQQPPSRTAMHHPPPRPVQPAVPERAPPAPADGRLCAGSVVSGTCWVVDGDTIVIDGQNIRLAGIDAPELDHPWGQKSKWALVALCRGETVRARITGELSYNRAVAICHLSDGRDLGAEMVRMGLAIDWPKYSGGRYRHLEPPGVRRRLWRADARQKGRLPPSSSGTGS